MPKLLIKAYYHLATETRTTRKSCAWHGRLCVQTPRPTFETTGLAIRIAGGGAEPVAGPITAVAAAIRTTEASRVTAHTVGAGTTRAAASPIPRSARREKNHEVTTNSITVL